MIDRLLKSENHAKTIEHFIIHEKYEHNDKDLSEMLEMYPDKRNSVLNDLLDIGVIRVTKKIAGTKFYRVNEESPLLIPLRILVIDMTRIMSTREAERQMNENFIDQHDAIITCPKCQCESEIDDVKIKIIEKDEIKVSIYTHCLQCNLKFKIIYKDERDTLK